MDVRRSDDPWTAPIGSLPKREPGAPSYAVLAALHIGMFFAVSSLAALLVPAAQEASLTAAGGAAAVAAIAAFCGVAALRQYRPVAMWVADFSFAAAAVYLGIAAAAASLVAGSADRTALLCGALAATLVAGSGYARVRRIWLQITLVAGVGAAILALASLGNGMPAVVDGAYLLVLAGFVAAGAAGGVVRPVGSGYVLAAITALAGAHVALDGAAGLANLVPVAVLIAVAALLLRTGSASLLPVLVIGGVLLVPSALEPLFGAGRAFGLGLLGVGAAVAWLVVDVQRRAVQPKQTGGVFFCCTALVLLSSPFLTYQSATSVALLASLALVAFFGAAAAARRRPATVLSGLLLVLTVPPVLTRPFGDGQVATVLVQLSLAAAAVASAVLLDRRAPRPAAATGEDWLAAPGLDAVLDAPYPAVFDTAVRLIGMSGLQLQVVNRAAGRLLAGPAEAPVLGVAAWQTGPVTTRLRVVGPQPDGERFLQDLRGELERSNVVARPH